jgi:hypothetical protein
MRATQVGIALISTVYFDAHPLQLFLVARMPDRSSTRAGSHEKHRSAFGRPLLVRLRAVVFPYLGDSAVAEQLIPFSVRANTGTLLTAQGCA